MNSKEFYETYWKAGGYTSQVGLYSQYKKAYIKNIGFNDKKILDVGCGDGEFSSLLLGNNNQVFGLDISEIAVKTAQKRGIKADLFNINESFPFEDRSFDVVLLFDTLEHIFDPCSVLRESYRVLKKDGILYCGVPNAAMVLNRLHFLFTGCFRDSSAISHKIIPELFFADHIRFFSPKIIKKLLKEFNFSVQKTDYWFPDHFEKPFSRKLSWIAKTILFFKLEKILPGLISFNIFIEAVKKPT